MTTEGMPSRYANDADAAEAWKDGRQSADQAHAYSEAYWTPFETDGTKVGLPFLYADGGLLAEAYADGYSTRAQDLADGTAQD
ncbi:hypothetical protein ACFW2V_13385 [Streptomyces sp. NPDC058947]|uniref:hypothetical protein n=1 Tax=Streptomyces sp. NPDC058947 TaxID=3346675 RepID=UPI0036BD9F9F